MEEAIRGAMRAGATGGHEFYVKEGPLNANWVKEADSVSAFQLGSSASKASSVGK